MKRPTSRISHLESPIPPVTPFQQRVYDACSRIPRGNVTTYKMLAAAIGCSSARAVGQALKRNPFAPRVPCHRVVASDLSLGGFAGRSYGPETDRKQRMLEAEGVAFQNDRIAHSGDVYTFAD